MIYGYIRTSRAAAAGLAGHAPRNPGPGPVRCRCAHVARVGLLAHVDVVDRTDPALVGCLRSDGIVGVGGSVRLGVLLSIR